MELPDITAHPYRVYKNGEELAREDNILSAVEAACHFIWEDEGHDTVTIVGVREGDTMAITAGVAIKSVLAQACEDAESDREKARHLDKLKALGVDNWEGYRGADADGEEDLD